VEENKSWMLADYNLSTNCTLLDVLETAKQHQKRILKSSVSFLSPYVMCGSRD